MRVVLDTNILVSFLLTRGEAVSSIFNGWEKGQFILLASEEILLEVKQALEKFVRSNLIPGERAQALLRRIRKETRMVVIQTVVKIAKKRSDNRFLACAKDGRADYLVTGDKKHLLPLKKFGKTKIISAKEFVKILDTKVF